MDKKVLISYIFMILFISIGFNGVGGRDENNIQHLSQEKSVLLLNDSEASPIFAGASAKAITPDLERHDPIYLAGFGRGRKATGIHDDIWSRCCCIRIKDTTFAIVSVDLIGVMYSEYHRIIERIPDSITIDHIILSSTHNHEGPDVIGLWGPGFTTGVHWEWYEEAMDTIVETIIDAYISMVPAGLRFGHADAEGFSRDSRDPHCTDDQVETIQLVDYNLTPISTMIFYGSHPEILWDKNTLITSDYPHYIYQHIEETVGGTAIFVIGAIGGLITPQVPGHSFEDARLFGNALAALCLESIQNSSVIWDTMIRIDSQEIDIPLTNPIFKVASILGILNRPIYHLRRDVMTAVCVIELGEEGSLAQIVTVPGEEFPESWLELKEKLHADHRILIGLGLDELGYIVPTEDFDWREYEESMSASRFLDQRIHQVLERRLSLKEP